MSLKTELEKLVRIYDPASVMEELAGVISDELLSRDDDIHQLTQDLESTRVDRDYFENEMIILSSRVDEAEDRAANAEGELLDIRNNFSTLIKTVYEEEDKLNG